MLKENIYTESLDELQEFLCEFLGVDKLKIKVEDIKEDSILDIKNTCIVISKEKAKDIIETKKALIHEMRHQYQIYCVALNIEEEKMKDIWAKELKEDVHKYEIDIMNRFYIEVDAYAFTKEFMKERSDYDVIYSSEYEEVVKNYINNNLIK